MPARLAVDVSGKLSLNTTQLDNLVLKIVKDARYDKCTDPDYQNREKRKREALKR